jgi:small subunit ribosomal protein S4
MRKPHKKYSRPRQLYNSARIKDENELLKEFGLKNKKEVWKANSEVFRMRRKAKNLLKHPAEKQEMFIAKLKEKGLDVKSIDDILGLDVRDILERRLQTIIFKKRIATTIKGARQLITHKKVSVNGQIINIPSYIVQLDEEDKIKLMVKQKKEKANKIGISDIEQEIKNTKGGETEE